MFRCTLFFALLAMVAAFIPATSRLSSSKLSMAVDWLGASKLSQSTFDNFKNVLVPKPRNSSPVSSKKSAAAVSKSDAKASASIPQGAIVTKLGVWGGRPDPTPEMKAPEKTNFISAKWRYNPGSKYSN